MPPLTSVRQSVYEIGVSAAKAMFDLLNKKHPPSQIVKAELIVRESTAKCLNK
jgi:LacI family transcriptional regulator